MAKPYTKTTEPVETPILCVDCKHCNRLLDAFSTENVVREYFCAHPSSVNPVTGRSLTCDVMRKGACGEQGKLYAAAKKRDAQTEAKG